MLKKNMLWNLAPITLISFGIFQSTAQAATDSISESNIVSRETTVNVVNPWVLKPADESIQNYAREIFARNLQTYQASLHQVKEVQVKETEYDCMVDNIVHEAPYDYDGMLAVATVTMNRLHDWKHYPHTICGVVFQSTLVKNPDGSQAYETDSEGAFLLDADDRVIPKRVCQYTWTCQAQDYVISKVRWVLARRVAIDALRYHKRTPGFENVVKYMNPTVAAARYGMTEAKFTGNGRAYRFKRQIGPHRFYERCSTNG